MYKYLLAGFVATLVLGSAFGVSAIASSADAADSSVASVGVPGAIATPVMPGGCTGDCAGTGMAGAGNPVMAANAVNMVGEPWTGSGTITGLDLAGISLQQADGTVIYVELGPNHYWTSQGLNLSAGMVVDITGFFNGAQYHAATVTANGQTMQLRTEAGLPLWSGGPMAQGNAGAAQGVQAGSANAGQGAAAGNQFAGQGNPNAGQGNTSAGVGQGAGNGQGYMGGRNGMDMPPGRAAGGMGQGQCTGQAVSAEQLADLQAQTGGDQVAYGEALFASSCSACHGAEAVGSVIAPTLGGDGDLPALTDDAITTIISGGVAGTAMPAWGAQLAATDIEAILAYLRSLE